MLSGNTKTVQLLIEKGLDVNAITSWYNSPLLNIAAREGVAEIGQLLLDNGADPYLGDDWNDPALNVAAYFGQLAFVQMLLDNGIQVYTPNVNDKTALIHALEQNRTM
ncbi:MAG: ankyrin repeat domain-containing protein [Anaerolineae bacterium]|nr:ankyrin repeat domain-containing protein [Anaerolineae bacterium]